MKTTQVLNSFGKILMEDVRDQTLYYFQKVVAGEMKSSEALKMFQLLSGLDEESKAVTQTLVKYMLDNQLFNFLNMFEQNEQYTIMHKDGNVITDVKEESDGLAGELYSEDGWIAQYSEYE